MIDMHEHGSFQQLYHPGQLCRKDRETLFIISAWRLVIERHGGDRLGPAACRAAEDTRVSLQLQQRLSAGAVECSCRRCREGQWVAAVSNVEGGQWSAAVGDVAGVAAVSRWLLTCRVVSDRLAPVEVPQPRGAWAAERIFKGCVG